MIISHFYAQSISIDILLCLLRRVLLSRVCLVSVGVAEGGHDRLDCSLEDCRDIGERSMIEWLARVDGVCVYRMLGINARLPGSMNSLEMHTAAPNLFSSYFHV